MRPGLPTAVAMVVLTWVPLMGDDQPQSTHDAVSPSHWSYEALRRVASELEVPGLTPARFCGAYTFSRSEMAEMAWQAAEALCPGAAGGATDAETLRWLVAVLKEYEWELESQGRTVGEAIDALWPEEQNRTELYGHLGAAVVASNAGGAVIDPTATVGMARFSHSPSMFGMVEGTYVPADVRQDRLGQPPLSRAVHYWLWPDYRFSIGRDTLRIGPGARGNYTYSETTGSLDHVRYRDRFQLFGTRFVADFALGTREHAGERGWVLTHRIEKRLSPDVEFGIGETGIFTGFPPTLYFIGPMQTMGALYEHTLGRPGTWDQDNLMEHADLYWTVSPSVHLYAEAALDELNLGNWAEKTGLRAWLASLPLIGLWSEIQQPITYVGETQGGFLLGAYSPDLCGNSRWRLRAEYAYSSRLMGIGTRWEGLDFFAEGRPMQHRIGPDARGATVALDYIGDGKWAAQGIAEYTQRGLSRPGPEGELLLGLRYDRQLGRDTTLRLGLTHRQYTNYRHVPGTRRSITSATAGAAWWF